MIAEAKSHGLAAVVWAVPARPVDHQAGRDRASTWSPTRRRSPPSSAPTSSRSSRPPSTSSRPRPRRPTRRPRSRSPRSADRVRHVVQSAFNGRRIVIFSGGATKENDGALRRVPGHPGRRRLRLHHRPQRLPAGQAARPRVPGHGDEDLLRRAEVAGPVATAPQSRPKAQVREYMRTLSNWGRWGKDDELGTINLITPDKRAAAARLVKDGVSVTCARPWTTEITAGDHRPAACASWWTRARGAITTATSASSSAGAPPNSSAWSSTATPSPTWTRPRTISGRASSTTAAPPTWSPRAKAPPSTPSRCSATAW